MNGQKRSLGERINTWVQIIAILCAGVWALYNFIYKEYWIPKTAPLNISLNLQLNKISINDKIKKDHSVVELNAVAINPSSQEVKLLSSAFIIYGYKVADVKLNDNDFVEICDVTLKKPYSMACIMKDIKNEVVSVIAVGGLYHDSILKPNEKIERSIIIHIPVNKYDIIEAVVEVPTVREKDGIILNWKINENKTGLKYTLYRTSNGKWEIIENDKLGELRKKIDLQFAHSAKMISLWRK